MPHSTRVTWAVLASIWFAAVGLIVGCDDATDNVRMIRAQRQLRQTQSAEVDHIGEAFDLLDSLVSLNRQQARRRILFHLNRWLDGRNPARRDVSAAQADVAAGPPDAPADAADLPAAIKPIAKLVGVDRIADQWRRTNFDDGDVDYLRDAYLTRQIVRWVDDADSGYTDPVLASWLSTLQGQDRRTMMTASRLFDFVARHVAPEPDQIPLPLTVPWPEAAADVGVRLGGPGYRQDNYATLFRGSGDWVSRSAVWIALCRAAGVDAFMIGVPVEGSTGDATPWCLAARVGDQAYLFEPRLGIHVPGPGGVGIATLAQARRDESVLRRMRVPGFFDYPLSRGDISACVAMVPVRAIGLSDRMRRLETGLTGDRRLNLSVDLDALFERIDAIGGVSNVRVWSLPYLSDLYAEAVAMVESRDAQLAAVNQVRWMVLESESPVAQRLAKGRWKQLTGRFVDDEEESLEGARTIYLDQRSPEFEIADLQTDLELQKRYGVRRGEGEDETEYRRQVAMVQDMIRMGKRAATYWLSLIQYDIGEYENASNWFDKRVLNGEPSRWMLHAKYNLARTYERTGQYDRAIEIYKTRGLPNEHGHRIRARLLDDLKNSSTAEK